jgi:hypothetical protein
VPVHDSGVTWRYSVATTDGPSGASVTGSTAMSRRKSRGKAGKRRRAGRKSRASL